MLAACMSVVAVSVAKVGMPDLSPGASVTADGAEAAAGWSAGDVVGAGGFVVCLGCAVAVIAILSNGVTAIIAAIHGAGSALAAIGCVAACASM